MPKIETVTRVPESLGVSFALIGGHAVGLRGHPRMTLDYDLLTTDRRVLQRDPWVALERAGAKVDLREGAQGVIDRAEVLNVAGLKIPVPRTSDFILLKLAAGGYHDLQDAAILLEVADRESIVREVDERIGALPLDAAEAWRGVLSGKTR